jgi:hypothetical protein
MMKMYAGVTVPAKVTFVLEGQHVVYCDHGAAYCFSFGDYIDHREASDAHNIPCWRSINI